jgi:hypothetical protein
MSKISHWKPTGDSLLWELIEGAIAAIVIGAISYGFGMLLGWNDQLRNLAAGATFLLALLVVVVFLRLYSEKMGLLLVSKRAGIVRTFPNLDACKEDMQEEFERAKKVRLLLQIGRKEFGNGEASYFYPLTKAKHNPEAHIKILRASVQSPFLSEQRATRRTDDKLRIWREDIRRLEEQIDILRSTSKVKIEERQHHEPYLWRIFIFDGVAYVSGYLYPSDVDSKSVVYKFKYGDTSLYTVFKKYFDYLWEKYDPADQREPNEKWAEWE